MEESTMTDKVYTQQELKEMADQLLAADMRGGKHNGVGALVIEELFHRNGIKQVKFFMRSAHQIVISSLFKIIPNCRSYQTSVTGNVYL